MAKKIKFPLTMDDDVQVRDLDELREHFDLDKVLEYYLDGKLLTWLEARYYDAEADEVRALDKNGIELRKKLCGIFDVEYDEEEPAASNLEEIEERNRKLSMLRQYTSDPAILEKVDSVAFDQEDLADLLDNDVHDIYLCNNSFSIPLRVENKKYIGIGKAEAVIKSEEWVDFTAKKIVFENVEFDEKYAKSAIAGRPDALMEEGMKAEEANEDAKAFSYYMQAAETGNADGMYHVAYAYIYGKGTSTDPEKAQEWLKKAIENGSKEAMLLQGKCYHEGIGGFGKNIDYAIEWYTKTAEIGFTKAMVALGDYYRHKRYDRPKVNRVNWYNPFSCLEGVEYQDSLPEETNAAIEWYKKAANVGDTEAMIRLGILYTDSFNGIGGSNYSEACSWYLKAADLGSLRAMAELCCVYEKDLYNHDEAIKWGQKAIEAGYDIVDLHYFMGKAWRGKANFVEAKKWLKQGIETGKNYWSESCRELLREIEREMGNA